MQDLFIGYTYFNEGFRLYIEDNLCEEYSLSE